MYYYDYLKMRRILLELEPLAVANCLLIGEDSQREVVEQLQNLELRVAFDPGDDIDDGATCSF